MARYQDAQVKLVKKFVDVKSVEGEGPPTGIQKFDITRGKSPKAAELQNIREGFCINARTEEKPLPGKLCASDGYAPVSPKTIV